MANKEIKKWVDGTIVELSNNLIEIANGMKTLQGDKGDAGPQGPIGPKGEQGPKGDSGDIEGLKVDNSNLFLYSHNIISLDGEDYNDTYTINILGESKIVLNSHLYDSDKTYISLIVDDFNLTLTKDKLIKLYKLLK